MLEVCNENSKESEIQPMVYKMNPITLAWGLQGGQAKMP